MQTALQKEQATDEDVYDKLACWCNTGNEEKTKAIAEAESTITQLTSMIEESTATIKQLESEIKGLEGEIAANNAALDQAGSIRQKEKEDFFKADKELAQALSALNSAITVLSKHHTPPNSAALLHIATVMKHTLHKFGSGNLSRKQRATVTSFLQAPADYFGAKPTFKAGYANQSGEIFGILQAMADNFSADQKAAQEEEARREAAYEQLKTAKQAEIAAAQASKDTKTGELADTNNKLANAKQDLEDTRNSLSADQTYLMDLKVKCQQTDSEWADRQKTRAQEIEAVSQAIAILSSDDAHDLFTRTFNKGAALLQLSLKSRLSAQKRAHVARLIRRAARGADAVNSASLLELASRVSLDAFEKVKESIDQMVVQLGKEKADEIAQRDWCLKEENQNERQTELKNRDKVDQEVKIDTLNQQISALAKEIEVLHAEIADLQHQLQVAGEERAAANADFQATVKDAQETQKLLSQALNVLKAFYEPKPAALVQNYLRSEPAGPPPPPGFTAYKNQNTGVLSLLEQILNESATLEKEATQAEADAQRAYETFVKDSNESIETKQKSLVNREETKSVAEADLNEAHQNLAGVVTELGQLASYAAQVHTACDFVVKNFDVRQSARDQEVEALKQAKAILSGMQSF